MKTTALALSLFLSLSLTSCDWDEKFVRIKGNGNVVTETREVSGDFTVIRASTGLQVYVSQGEEPGIRVETDENLHEYILTDIADGRLHIHLKKRVFLAHSKRKSIYVTTDRIEALHAGSGATVETKTQIKSEQLELSGSSGSRLEADVFSKKLTAKSSSGSSLKIKGKARDVFLKSSSGSNLKAGDLEAENAEVSASSGSTVYTNVSNSLEGKASSGSSIRYAGEPGRVGVKTSSGGSVKQQ